MSLMLLISSTRKCLNSCRILFSEYHKSQYHQTPATETTLEHELTLCVSHTVPTEDRTREIRRATVVLYAQMLRR